MGRFGALYQLCAALSGSMRGRGLPGAIAPGGRIVG